MPPRSYSKSSYSRNINPQENPASVYSVSNFKLQNTVVPSGNNTKNPIIKVIRIKISPYDDNFLSFNQPNQTANYYFNTAEGPYTPLTSYVQPSVSGNYILPHGSLYFDERLNLDSIDRAVKMTEDNAYLAEMFSRSANVASNEAHQEANRQSDQTPRFHIIAQ